jgi:hypothetical protein
MVRVVLLTAALVATLALGIPGLAPAAATQSSSPTWTEATPKNSPPSFDFMASTYDPVMKGVLAFGGQADGNTSNQTWLWTGKNWKLLHLTTSPPGITGAGMAYDPSTKQVVLFGGGNIDGYCQQLSCTETWVWSNKTWTSVSDATGPVNRLAPSLAYDKATSQLLMYGGNDPVCGMNGYAECSDTWEWTGTGWTELAPSGPGAGAYAVMAYDPSTKDVVLYGGDNANDTTTWTWNGTDWQTAATTGPCNTSYDSLARDAGGNLILFGGYGFCGPQDTTYEWIGSAWQLVSTSTSPPARSFASMAFDALTGKDVLFGGSDSTVLYDDTWTFADSQ